MVTSLDVAFSLLKKTESVFDYAFLPEPVAEFLGKFVVTTEHAVIEERGAGNGIPSGFCDTLVDRAGGVAYFEPEIK